MVSLALQYEIRVQQRKKKNFCHIGPKIYHTSHLTLRRPENASEEQRFAELVLLIICRGTSCHQPRKKPVNCHNVADVRVSASLAAESSLKLRCTHNYRPGLPSIGSAVVHIARWRGAVAHVPLKGRKTLPMLQRPQHCSAGAMCHPTRRWREARRAEPPVCFKREVPPGET